MNYSCNEQNISDITKTDLVKGKPSKISKKYPSNASTHQCLICGLLNHNAWALTLHMRRHNNERSAKCPHCTSSFITNSELKIHMNTHTNEKKYKCRFCSKWFVNKSTKYNHEDTHGILQHKCKFCLLTFPSQVERRIHQKTHIKEDLSCKFCIKRFVSEEFLSHHVNTYHNKTVKCMKCKLVFNTQEQLKVHRGSHKQTQTFHSRRKKNEVKFFQDTDVELSSYFFTCGICSSKFEIHSDLSKHIENMHPKEERDSIYKFKCSICDKSFDSKQKVRAHMIGHGPKRFKCPHCLYCTTRGKDLAKHISARHMVSKNVYKCSECQQQFSVFGTFVTHKLKHGEKKFKCDLCDKSFYLKVRLSLHKKNLHYSTTSICEHCGKVCSNRVSLKEHQRRSHQYPYSLCTCTVCGKTIDVIKIQDHRAACILVTNSPAQNMKALLCSKCCVTFPHKTDIIEHFRDIHPLEIFSCQFCAKQFLSRIRLQKHIDRLHQSNKPELKKRKHLLSKTEMKELKKISESCFFNNFYECFACGDSFSNELNLNIHCSKGICLQNKTREGSNYEPENYFITKLHEWEQETQILKDYLVKVIPLYLNQEPYAVKTHLWKDPKLLKKSILGSENSLRIKTKRFKNHLNENSSQPLGNTSYQDSSIQLLLQEKSNSDYFSNRIEELSFEQLSIISSESLLNLLQTKTINIDGTPFISYSELLKQLKTVSRVNVNL